MPPLDFPSSPTDGQLYLAPSNGVVYQWIATRGLWLVSAAPSGQVADFTAIYTGADFPIAAAGQVIVPSTMISGNAGGWYSTGGGTAGRFTPPAGRYKIWGALTGFSTTALVHINLSLRKNGVVVGTMQATSAAANSVAEPSISLTLDANGTDYFELFTGGNIAFTGRLAVFGAIPVGVVAVAPPVDLSRTVRLYDEVTLTTPAQEIRVAMPNPTIAKKIEFQWAVQTDDGAMDSGLAVHVLLGATYQPSGYNYGMHYNGAGGAVSGSTQNGTPYFNFGGFQGHSGNMNVMPNTKYGALNVSGTTDCWQSATGQLAITIAGWVNPTGGLPAATGFRFSSVSGRNWSVGSFVRCFAVGG